MIWIDLLLVGVAFVTCLVTSLLILRERSQRTVYRKRDKVSPLRVRLAETGITTDHLTDLELLARAPQLDAITRLERDNPQELVQRMKDVLR